MLVRITWLFGVTICIRSSPSMFQLLSDFGGQKVKSIGNQPKLSKYTE